MKLYSYLKYLFFFCAIVVHEIQCAKKTDENKFILPFACTKHHINFTNDLPAKKDIMVYLNALDLIMNFADKIYKNEIDLNFEFGLFLVNVNLKYITKMKSSSLPAQVLKKINEILYKNDDLLFFQSMVANDKNSADNSRKSIFKFTLFSNNTQWTRRIPNQQSVVALQTAPQSRRELEGVFSKWASYVNKVDQVTRWVPSPCLSDECLETLASTDYITNMKSKFDSLPKCEVSNSCYKMLIEGTDFGYALSHRMLLLLFARLSRSCTFFSPMSDRELIRSLCATAYNEAQYIAMNDFKLVDLILEQMTFCSLGGHTEFLRRSWMKQILRFQYPRGCFGSVIYKPKLRKISREADIGEECIGHTTSVAAAALSSMVRFLLDIFY